MVSQQLSDPDDAARIAHMQRDGVNDIRNKKKISSRENMQMYTSDKEDKVEGNQQTDRSELQNTDRPLINTSNVRRDGVYESSRSRQ